MEIYQIRYFLAAAETGNFTRAAERVHVSQPTLSAGIKKLEQGLQASLFDRQARKTVLTPAGIRFMDRARIIMAEVDRARTELSETTQSRSLKLGCLPGIPAARLADLLAAFTGSYSNIALEVLEAEAGRLEQWLDQGRIDMALTTTAADRNSETKSHDIKPLFRQNMVLAMSPDHALASRQIIRPEDLKDQPYVLRQHCPFVRPLNSYFTERNIRPAVVCRTRQDNRAMTLVAAGMGVTILHLPSTIALINPAGLDNEAANLFRTFATSHDWKPHDSDDASTARLNWAH